MVDLCHQSIISEDIVNVLSDIVEVISLSLRQYDFDVGINIHVHMYMYQHVILELTKCRKML